MSDELPKRLRDQLERMPPALDAVEGALSRLGRQGLQRASASSAAELQALAQTAHNAGMVRVERALTALQTYVERYLARDPLFTVGDYGGAINRAWLLCGATRARLAEGKAQPEMLDLLGEARRTYEYVDGPLELQALGAWGWASDTGFIGITACMWSPGGLLELASARPAMHFGDDPSVLLRMPVLPDGKSMARLIHGAWRFENAKASRDGRLSLHQELAVSTAPYLGARAYEALTTDDWRVLLQRLREAAVDPVGSAPPVLAYIQPRQLGPLTVDDKRAEAWMLATDARDTRLRISVPLRRENTLLVENLGALGPGLDGLFGRARANAGVLVFEPLTAVLPTRPEPLCHLTLEPLEG